MTQLPDTATAGLPADRNPVSVHVAGLGSSHSRDAVVQAAAKGLSLLLGQSVSRDHVYRFPWEELRYSHVVHMRQALVDEGLAPSTVNAYVAHVKSICRECWRLGHLDADSHTRIQDVQGVKGARLPAGRALSAGELRALFAACNDGSTSGVRDCALLATLYGAGLRRGELVALQVEDHDPEAATLTINGKGGRQRLAHLPAGARDALASWLAVRGDWEGPLFVAVSRAGHIGERTLSTEAVAEALARRARKAGIGPVTPHDLRRSFVSDLLDAGADLSVAAGLAGHSQLTTTQQYDRRPEHARRRAASLLHVPVGSSG